ncbi:MAG TPA: hypothetical protein VN960_08780 [Gaiellaceae bacterium]|jgi:hypothetical protein|nr:hypothetical protein [Gaiellaceae bacterium]
MSKVTADTSPSDPLRRILQALVVAVLVPRGHEGVPGSEPLRACIEADEHEEEELEGRAPTLVELEPAVEAVFR